MCLAKDLKDRTVTDARIIYKYLKDGDFISHLLKDRDEKTLNEFCQKLRLEEHQTSSVVFHYGDPGSNFYCILSGSVNVRIPSLVELEEDSATPEGLISFIVMYFKDIYWKEIENCSFVLHLLYNELTRCDIEFDEKGIFDQ